MELDDGRVISNFIVQALQGQNITVYGDGTQKRSFCYVSDMIKGMVSMMQSSHSGPLNLGNPVEKSIVDVAHDILKLTKSHSRIVFVPLPEDDPKKRKPDINLAEKELHWKPQVGFEEGITRSIQDFKDRLARIE